MFIFFFRVLDENVDRVKRAYMMNEINPKFVLRNWMSVLAYEKAELGDMTVLQELELLLRNPYDDQSREMTEKWFRKTPSWAERSVIYKLKKYTSM
jgi:serine/tyrosine/threonine adenylyltransferase